MYLTEIYYIFKLLAPYIVQHHFFHQDNATRDLLDHIKHKHVTFRHHMATTCTNTSCTDKIRFETPYLSKKNYKCLCSYKEMQNWVFTSLFR